MQTDTEETPAGMEAILPPRDSHQAVYAQKVTSAEWRGFLDRIPLNARGDGATLLAAAYFFLLRIERDLADRQTLPEPIFRSVGRRSRNLLMWAYREVI
jgi:hypothetical protein